MARKIMLIFYSLLAFLGQVKADVALNATSEIDSTWASGYTAHIDINNNTSSTVNSWKIFFSLPEGHTVESLWNGSKIIQGNQITVINADWNGTLQPQEKVSIGFQVSAGSSSPAINNLIAVGNPQNPLPDPDPTQPSTLSARYSIGSSWDTGAQVTVSITNTGSTPTDSWTAYFTLPQGLNISSLWNGILSMSGSEVTVRNPSWEGAGRILPQSTVTFGMIVTKPSGVNIVLNNLQAQANGGDPLPPEPIYVDPPVLQPIENPSGLSGYQIVWSTVSNAEGYIVQESNNSGFTNHRTIYNGPETSYTVFGRQLGEYFYRVSAYAQGTFSNFSNVMSTNVFQEPDTDAPIIIGYWESWNSRTPVTTIANMQSDIIPISFGNFISTGNHTFRVSGVESNEGVMSQLVSEGHRLGKKIIIAIGGASYPLSPQLKTVEDANGMAQAIATYIQENNLDGVDFDIEDFPAANLQIALIKRTRELLGNDMFVCYTPMSPAATTAPFAQVIQQAHQYLDCISIMAYNYGPGYTFQQDVADLVEMGVPASKIAWGLMPGYDDTRKYTSVENIRAAAQYVLDNGLKGIMFWDLNRDHENTTGLGVDAATNTAASILRR